MATSGRSGPSNDDSRRWRSAADELHAEPSDPKTPDPETAAKRRPAPVRPPVGQEYPADGPDVAETLRTPALQLVLEEIRLGTASTRREVVASTGLSASAAARAIRELVDLGLLEYAERASSTGGRAARILRLAEGRLVLGVEIEAHRISVGATDLAGQVLARVDAALPTDFEPAGALAELDAAVKRLYREIGAGPDHIVSAGCSLPGAVDVYHGDAIVASLPPQWVGFPLRDQLTERFGCPVWLQNDVKAMAIAELRVGGLRGSACGLVVKVDTGIGAGITIGESLHPGSQGWAGDIGHICIDEASEVLCRCGSRGCLEAFAGTDALVAEATRAARDGRSELLRRGLDSRGELSVADIASSAAQGDQAALIILQRASERTGKVVSMVVNVLNPDVIVLAGALPAAAGSFLSGIRMQVYQHSHPFATRHLTIEQSAFTNGAGVLAAAWLALDKYFQALAPPAPGRAPKSARGTYRAAETGPPDRARPMPARPSVRSGPSSEALKTRPHARSR